MPVGAAVGRARVSCDEWLTRRISHSSSGGLFKLPKILVVLGGPVTLEDLRRKREREVRYLLIGGTLRILILATG